jgi:hypothetical protein
VSTPSPVSTAFRERTALAWQRTGLSILVGSLVLLRVTGSRGGWPTVTLLLAGGALGLFTSVESRRRARASAGTAGNAGAVRTAETVGTAETSGWDGGRVALLMSAAVTLLLLAELDAVLVGP